jgi:hypothetical protein
MEYRPKMIIAGGSAYPREWDYKRFREIADKVCGRPPAGWCILVAAGSVVVVGGRLGGCYGRPCSSTSGQSSVERCSPPVAAACWLLHACCRDHRLRHA